MPELRTHIDSVVVYPDRARIQRKGTLHLEPSVHRLETAEDLPASLDTASLRAAARGSGRGRLVGVDVGQRFYAEPRAQKLRDLEAQMHALTDDLSIIEAKRHTLMREEEELRNLQGQNRAFAKGLAERTLTPEGHMGMLDRFRQRSEAISAAIVEQNVHQRSKERQLEKVRREMELIKQSAGNKYFAAIDLEVMEEGDFEVDVSYVVSRAWWEPVYDIRLVEEETSSVLEVGYLGQVKQQTGEDWADATLTLSTARPAVTAVLPELEPWYVGPLPPPAAPAPMYTTARLAAAAPAEETRRHLLAEADMAMPLAEVEAPQATVSAQGAAVMYQIPGRTTIPCDGTPRKVTVARYNLSPKLDYTTAPKLVSAAYRRAKAANESDYTLLPGQVSLFAGEEFIGSSRLELIAPGGEMELFLGADDRVQVERELTRRQVDKRFASSKRRIHYGYEITVHNLLSTTATVTLFDQLPNATHEAVNVHMESAQPEPSKKTDLNILSWDIVLEPAEKKTVRFEFSVEHPQDMVVTGLP
jgi:uncharacterized protein (TIGR02231 family)